MVEDDNHSSQTESDSSDSSMNNEEPEERRDLDVDYKQGVTATMPCFITTACVGAMGLSDDCLELRTLRGLRSNYVVTSRRGSRLLEQYAETSHKILRIIGRQPNPTEILKRIYKMDIRRAVDLTLAGAYEKAMDHYVGMVRRLENGVFE
ncbi:hypothetical protein JW711_04240 [Candidatus Woesearchaeota archaeon]|nr:hypothetical protein [Candidatus Woesearchaeota archaeon]